MTDPFGGRPPGRVLIIKLRHLGDVLTTTPLIAGIKAAWPGAGIDYLINPGGEDLVRHHPDVSRVFTVPREGGLGPQLGLIRDLRRRRYDLAIELSWGDRGAFLARAAGARVRVGYQPKKRVPLDRRLLYTHMVTSIGSSKHTVRYHLDALRVLGVEPGDLPMALRYPDAARERARELLGEAGLDPDRPHAVVHPTSRWMFKAWQPSGNAAVIDRLHDEAGLAVAVTSSPDAVEKAFVRKVLDLTHAPVADLSGRLNLSELAAVIDGARMFFGVDSLPMHMAAALNTPAVALFGPSGEHMWGPWGPGHRVVAKDWDCRPCGRDGCGGSKVSRCLVEISTDEVWEAVSDVLAGAS